MVKTLTLRWTIVAEDNNEVVPVWALATEEVSVPDVLGEEGMTAARLSELRTVLASLAVSPIATLEAHSIIKKRDPDGGIVLHASSPLAQQLSQLVSQTAKSAPSAANVATSGEVLYKMIVPAKVAAQVGKGLVKPMQSKAVAGGIHSALRSSTKVVSNATFVPVAGKAAGASVAAGAIGGSAATAGVAVASAGALTVAAPLVLMALAVGVAAYTDQQRTKAIENITDLLHQLHDAKLDDERADLDGCRGAIDKATSILLDQGRIGHSLGLDSAVHEIDKAIALTETRLKKWQNSLASLPEGPVELSALTKAFPGIDEEGGKFRAHLELARLALALKRRVLILQAVEHAQLDNEKNPFKAFVSSLQDDERSLDKLETGLTSTRLRLSTLELMHRRGIQGVVFTGAQVDGILKAAYRLHALADDIESTTQPGDVTVEIERSRDGSLIVFPAEASESN